MVLVVVVRVRFTTVPGVLGVAGVAGAYVPFSQSIERIVDRVVE